MSKILKFVFLGLFIIVLGNLVFLYFYFKPNPEIKIGVMMPLTGPDALDTDKTLNWAVKNLNEAGGIYGKEIRLVYKDTYKHFYQKIAAEFLQDPSIKIVIGPETSDELMSLAPEFIKRKKILVAPMSTADEIARVYAKKGYIWRTTQADTAQIRVILSYLKTKHVKKISLIYDDSLYGQTFYHWLGFFALEAGIDVTSMTKNTDPINTALQGNPEYIIGAVFPEFAVKIKKELIKLNSPVKLLFTDSAESQYILDKLGAKAIGIEICSPAANPNSGFDEIYNKNFGYYPFDFSALTYDALLLAAYALARNEYTKKNFKFENILESFQKIAYGKGEIVKWQENKKALDLIKKGQKFNTWGASGPLDYDPEYGVDPLTTYYAFSRVEKKKLLDYWTTKYVSSDESKMLGKLEADQIAIRTKASTTNLQNISKSKTNLTTFKPKKSLWAVIVATSKDWQNYRHQADALAFYNFLKAKGVTDDHIVLIIYDDIANNFFNLKKGDVHHEIKGRNLYSNIVIDYGKKEANIENFSKALLTLGSNENSNVLLYICGHGGKDTMDFMGDLFPTNILNNLIEKMWQEKKFRQMLILIDTCHSESMVLNLDTPGVIALTSAATSEYSFARDYDKNVLNWINDQFSYYLLKAVADKPDATISEIYEMVYKNVSGSHVRLRNFEKFGDLNMPIKEFFLPAKN